MILYTPLPLEYVLEGLEKERIYQEVEIDGVTMIVEKINEQESKIVKLISSNPFDYLNPSWQPGTIITSKMHLKNNCSCR